MLKIRAKPGAVAQIGGKLSIREALPMAPPRRTDSLCSQREARAVATADRIGVDALAICDVFACEAVLTTVGRGHLAVFTPEKCAHLQVAHV